MKEEFLHYLWRFRLYQTPLKSTHNEAVEVLNPGIYNTNAGPDFLQASVKLHNTIWVGNIEIHLKASDWEKHQHQKDKAYNSTILHVVYECDTRSFLENGEELPCVELRGKINLGLLDTYESFLLSKKWIPCSGQIAEFPNLKWEAFYARLLAERLEEKTKTLQVRLEKNRNDWEETFYQSLAGSFGLKINHDAFIQLAEELPLKVLLKYRNHLFQIEALLFGQAGMLSKESFEEEYPQKLSSEYQFLAKKFGLKPMLLSQWKYLRLRPSNFPNIRIAQFAKLLSSYQNLFSKIIETESFVDVSDLFRVAASEFWDTHFVWNKTSEKRVKSISNDRFAIILINTIVPFLFLYGRMHDKEPIVERSFQFLENLSAEKNTISKSFEKEGLLVKSAFQTQALLQLKLAYCDRKNCLDCPIGNYLLH